MSNEEIYGVDGMTRQQFERDLRSRYQHDNVRQKERGIRIDLERDEKDIQERVTLNYGKANCPGCGAFDVGMSEVNFVQGCVGCAARMKAANGLGPTPAPEYFARIYPLPDASPTQGADARPVAIYQVNYFGNNGPVWIDCTKEEYTDAGSKNITRIVYATHDAAPSDAQDDSDAARYRQLRKHAGQIGSLLWRNAPWTHESLEENQARLDLCLDEERVDAIAAIAPREET